MLRKKLFLLVLAMMISIAINSSAQEWADMGAATGSPLDAIPPAEHLEVEVEPIDVLFVVSEDDGFVPWQAIYNEVCNLPEIGICERFNSFTGTPDISLLMKFCVVIVWSNSPQNNPDLLGNNLADYIDAGGSVIAAAPTRIPPSWYIGGRFRAEGYDPFTRETGPLGPATLGAKSAHPIMTTPYAINTLWGDFRTDAVMDPGAEWLADWSDKKPLAALKGKVVGLTSFLHDGFWDGQFPQLLANACVWLCDVTESCIEGKVKDERTQDPIRFAIVLAIQLPSKDVFWALTDNNGYYNIVCPAGLYLVIAIKKNYQPAWQIANVPPGGCVTKDFDLVK
jgi:hypothetical protein